MCGRARTRWVRSRPQTLNHFDSNGVVTIQETVNEGGSSPAKRLFLNATGEVTSQCLLDAEGKKLNTRAIFVGGMIAEVLVDTTGNGVADNRDVYENGKERAHRSRHEQ